MITPNLYERIKTAIRSMKWRPGPDPQACPADCSMETYQGVYDGIRVLTVHYRSRGREGYDGTAVDGGLVLRLPADLAQMAFDAALKEKS